MFEKFVGAALLAAVVGCGPSANPVADRLTGTKLADVQVEGHVAKLQDTFFGYRILSDYAKKEIWKEAHNAFAHPDDDVYNKGIGMWRGEFWGKLMISACRVCEYTHNRELEEFLHQEALDLIKFQQPDGYLGTYVNKEYVTPLPLEEQKARLGWPCDWNWNLWCRKYTLWGLLACYHLTGDQVLLQAADKAMSQQIDMLERRGLKLCETGTTAMRGLPPCSILKPLLWLYRDTGREKYLEYAHEIVGYFSDPSCRSPQFAAMLASGKPIQDWYPSENGHWGKAYEMMSCLDGFVEYYRTTGDRKALDVAIGMQERIHTDELNLCRSVGYNDQFWGAARHLNGVSEPCDAVHWMRLNYDLYLVTGESKYMDAFEETFYNAFLAAVQPDGKWGARMVRTHGRHAKAPVQCDFHLQHCCVNNMPRGFMDAAQAMVSKDASGALYIALYHDAKAKIGDDEVEFSGNYPVRGEVTVNLRKAAAGAVCFRKPVWCPSLTVCNGDSCTRAMNGGWVRVEAPAGDSEWKLTFDMNARLVESARAPVAAYDPHSPLVTRWARNEPRPKGERDLLPLLVKVPMAQVMWGPMLLAKSVRVGDVRADILDNHTVNGQGWRISVKPVDNAKKVWGAWSVTFEKGVNSRTFGVCDYPSAAIWSDDRIEFSTLF